MFRKNLKIIDRHESQSTNGETYSYIESYGTYLPPERFSTRQLMRSVKTKDYIPLRMATGIKYRRMAKDMSSFDLATRAVDKCLQRTVSPVSDIDLIIACNIGKLQAGGKVAEFEPSEASLMAHYLGVSHAMCFDVNNACAGMLTGIHIANNMIADKQIRSALVFSGEYISHIAHTAAKEIDSIRDQRLACLTLGDGGAAVLLGATEDISIGFRYTKFQCFPQYSHLCYALPSDREHGGVIMMTDALQMILNGSRLTRKVLIEAIRSDHIKWSKKTWVIPHQVSARSIYKFTKMIRKDLGVTNLRRKAVVSNVSEIGNTASTSHFLAFARSIAKGKIKDHEHVVFAVQASGLVIGVFEYQLDDLPSRINRSKKTKTPENILRGRSSDRSLIRPCARRLSIKGIGVVGDQGSTAKTASEAARVCLVSAKVSTAQVNLLIHTGVLRTDWVEEPASSAIIAKDLGLESSGSLSPFLSFDIINGSLGFLDAIFAATALSRRAECSNILITHSENLSDNGLHSTLAGDSEAVGSAMILEESQDNESGFGRFYFRVFTEHLSKRMVTLTMNGGTPELVVHQDDGYENVLAECVVVTLKEYISEIEMDIGDFKRVVLPQGSATFLSRIATELGVDMSTLVHRRMESRGRTTSIAMALNECLSDSDINSGDQILVVEAASGIQIGVAVYTV